MPAVAADERQRRAKRRLRGCSSVSNPSGDRHTAAEKVEIRSPAPGTCSSCSYWYSASARSSPWAFRSATKKRRSRSEEHTSELQSRVDLVCRLLLEKK